MPQLGFIAFLLVWAAGADVDRVRRRGEVNRYLTAGIFVAINGVWAFVATFVVVGVIDRHSPVAARIGFAALAGVLVFSIDRFLTGLPLTSNSTAQRAKAIVIRVFFALPWALFLANATDQVAYNPEITAQVIQDQSHQSGGLIEAAKQEYAKEVAPLNNDLASLKRATKAAGVRYGWASTMHNYALHHGGARSTVAKWAAEMKTDWSLFQQASANESAASKIINATILQYQAVEQNKIKAANNAITRSGGLLARQHALTEVRRSDTGADDLYWEIFVIFVVVELIPAFGKALQGQSLSDVEQASVVRATTAAINETELERTRQLTYAMRAELTQPGARPASLRDYPVQLQVVGVVAALALIAATVAVISRHKSASPSSQPPRPTATVTLTPPATTSVTAPSRPQAANRTKPPVRTLGVSPAKAFDAVVPHVGSTTLPAKAHKPAGTTGERVIAWVGSPVTNSACSDASCAGIAVTYSGFPAGPHSVSCFSSADGSVAFSTYSTSSPTSQRCFYGVPGATVWTTVDGVASAAITWP